MIAVPTLVVAYYVGHSAAESTIQSQREQLQQDEEQIRRRLLSEVYPAFLSAADEYHSAQYTLNHELDQCAREQLPSDDGFSCHLETVDDFVTKRWTFQGALNDVYVYGSAEAWEAASRLADLLPDARSDPTSGSVDLDYDDALTPAFLASYSEFLDVECQELNPVEVPERCE